MEQHAPLYDEKSLSQALPSHQIPVDYFEAALILPIHVQAAKHPNTDAYVDPSLDPTQSGFLDHWSQWIRKTSQIWHDVADYPDQTGESAYASYSEFCYVHPFVRNFRFMTRDDRRIAESRGSNTVHRNLRILKREDVKAFSIDYMLDNKKLHSDFSVRSCCLYLFDTQIAMLGLRLVHSQTKSAEACLDLKLSIVQRLQEVVRNVYSPYWSVFNTPKSPAEKRARNIVQESRPMPLQISLEIQKENTVEKVVSQFGNFSWTPKNDDENEILDITQKLKHAELPIERVDDELVKTQIDATNRHLQYVREHREPYTVEVWQRLLRPLSPQRYLSAEASLSHANTCEDRLRFEHIRDERAVVMSYISVAEGVIRKISDGDWLRIAAVDSPGSPTTLPYSPEFYRNSDPLQSFVYDRFWHSTGECNETDGRGKPTAMGHEWMSTRWMCSGYSFACVGDAGDKSFFSDEHSGALSQFRHHYFALTMIAMFHHASLLMYKHRLAEASDNMLSEHASERVRNADFRYSAERLAKEIMRFRTLYWFSEVSNQVQGAELFDMFRRHLRLQDLFGQVTGDTESAVALLRQWDSEDQARATQSIAILGAMLMIAGPLVNHLSDFPSSSISIAYVGASAMIAGLVLLSLRFPTNWLRTRSNDFGFSSVVRAIANHSRSIKPLFVAALLLPGLIATSVAVIAKWNEVDKKLTPVGKSATATSPQSTPPAPLVPSPAATSQPSTSLNSPQDPAVQPNNPTKLDKPRDADSAGALLETQPNQVVQPVESAASTTNDGSKPNDLITPPQKP